MVKLYHYEAGYRSIFTMAALIICTGLCAFGVYQAAPWYFLAVIGIPTALLAYNLALNPVSGVTLTERYILAFSGGWEMRHDLSRIQSVRVSVETEGPDRFTLNLKSGKMAIIPSLCIDKTERFKAVLKEAGLTVI